jgi:predicted nucleic acid-binding protein
MALVVDASVAVGRIARSQATPLTNAALSAIKRESGRIPAYFGIEIARALRNQERRNLLTSDVVDRGVVELRLLPLREDGSRSFDILRDVVALARSHQLRIADAVYLELARRTGLPLATRDVALAQSAEAAGLR